MEKLYLSLVLSSACLIAFLVDFLGINYYPKFNLILILPPTVQANEVQADSIFLWQSNLDSKISIREKELFEKARLQGFQIIEAQLDPQDSDQEIYLYTVLYENSTDSQWYNLCQPDQDNLTKAMLLSGQWDETGKHLDNQEVTIACTSGVLAKCVRWGYKPWKTLQGISLREYHQACTRMARADYCGNGISHTQDGTAIDLYDRLGIQQKTEDSGMVFEAAWGTDGAVFIDRPRYSETLVQIKQDCPEKIALEHQSLTKAEIQQQIPTALIFNDSFFRRPLSQPQEINDAIPR